MTLFMIPEATKLNLAAPVSSETLLDHHDQLPQHHLADNDAREKMISLLIPPSSTSLSSSEDSVQLLTQESSSSLRPSPLFRRQLIRSPRWKKSSPRETAQGGGIFAGSRRRGPIGSPSLASQKSSNNKMRDSGSTLPIGSPSCEYFPVCLVQLTKKKNLSDAELEQTSPLLGSVPAMPDNLCCHGTAKSKNPKSSDIPHVVESGSCLNGNCVLL
jgi:hypothetical protein